MTNDGKDDSNEKGRSDSKGSGLNEEKKLRTEGRLKKQPSSKDESCFNNCGLFFQFGNIFTSQFGG